MRLALISLLIPLLFMAPAMASEPSPTNSVLDKLNGLYLGAGLEYSKRSDGIAYSETYPTEAEAQLALLIRYAPDWSSRIRPYAQLAYKSAARPTDSFIEMFSHYGPETESKLRDLSWRLNTLDFRAGIETNITSASFVRAGLLVNHQDEQDMVKPLVAENLGVVSFSTRTRVGVFASVGQNFELGTMPVESSLVLSHYIPYSMGGKGLIEDCDGSLKWGDDDISNMDLCTRDGGDFVSGWTIASIDNHINIRPIAINTSLFFGQIRSSKMRQEEHDEALENGGKGLQLKSTTYGAVVTLGYEFGH
jgi:hypothetical protein